jgi:hypothetical protein
MHVLGIKIPQSNMSAVNLVTATYTNKAAQTHEQYIPNRADAYHLPLFN